MENENNTNQELQWSRKKIKIVFSVLGVLIILLGGGAGYFYYQSKNTNSDEKTVEQNKKELASMIEAVGKLILLPTDEEPTMATVSDPTKLQNQDFFLKAEKGDRVLIYSKAHKAILYSPTKNKIIEVAPINLNSTPKTDTVGATPGITP